MVRRAIVIMSIIMAGFILACVVMIFLSLTQPDNEIFSPLPYNRILFDNVSQSTVRTLEQSDTKKDDMNNSVPTQKQNERSSNYKKNPNGVIDVPVILQNPEFPTGCESVSATMLLNFYGSNIDAKDFVDRLPKGRKPYRGSDGYRHGPDPNLVFIGDPRNKGSYGVYAPAINKVINSFLNESKNTKGLTSVDISGASINELCKLIDEGIPVMVWGTINMAAPYEGKSWFIEVKPKRPLEDAVLNPNDESKDKVLFTWIKPQHAFILVGYDEDNFVFNDPLVGVVKYRRKDFIKAYEALGKQAIYIKS